MRACTMAAAQVMSTQTELNGDGKQKNSRSTAGANPLSMPSATTPTTH